MTNYDLFGDPIIEKKNLKDEFLIPPFSIFDTASGDWQQRKVRWKNLGIKSEEGRINDNRSQIMSSDGRMLGLKSNRSRPLGNNALRGGLLKRNHTKDKESYVSIFDPVLCEVIYNWFVRKGGSILDPFAGGSVRGVVANYLDYLYTGIELREEQVDANIQQGIDIVPNNRPSWICGDSNQILDTMDRKFDFVFSCPPYYDLEVYCDDPNDLSNMSHNEFNRVYESIIEKSCALLKDNRYACFVVGNCRDKDGYMMDLVGTTIRAFEKCGVRYYNDIILKNPVASASMRASTLMTYKKVVKVHQNVLVFCKGNPKSIII